MSYTIVKCDVRGTVFRTTLATLSSHGENKISKIVKKNAVMNHANIFFDRDPVIFRYVLNYLCGYKHFLPDVRSELKMLSEDAEFYEINELRDNINKLLESPEMYHDIFAPDYQKDIQHADDCQCEDDIMCEAFDHPDDCDCLPCRDSRYYNIHDGKHHPECTCLQRGGTECTSVASLESNDDDEDINSYSDVIKTITDSDNKPILAGKSEIEIPVTSLPPGMGQMPNLGALFQTLSSLKDNVGPDSSSKTSLESQQMLADLQGMAKMLTDSLGKMN